MPMAILSPHKNINILAGIGAGFMVGQTQFGDHVLDGPILFNAKVGCSFYSEKAGGLNILFIISPMRVYMNRTIAST